MRGGLRGRAYARVWGAAVALVLSVSAAAAQEIIPMEARDGAYVVPVVINGLLSENFIVDSGSADVSIPADVAAALVRQGSITAADLIGSKTYVMADGSRVPSPIYRLASLKIGAIIMQNVTVRVAAEKSHFLLGQSFLNRLKSWSMDNARQALVIN